jgi:hypothetical protein
VAPLDLLYDRLTEERVESKGAKGQKGMLVLKTRSVVDQVCAGWTVALRHG